MLPLEPIRPEGGLSQVSFLVEARSLPGSSGSPVFVYYPVVRGEGRSSIAFAEADFLRQRERVPRLHPLGSQGPVLLGVDWAHLHNYSPVLDENKDPVGDGWQVKMNTGMMCVVPAWKILEILDLPELVGARELEEAERARRVAESPVKQDDGAG
jgi:hypothetical protein